jgi:hypothetical protein
LVLVATSVALGTHVVSEASMTEQVWAARETLTPGENLTGAVVLVDVTPGVAAGYLPADAPLDATVDRVVGEGELVPVAAVIPVDEVDLRSVVVPAGSQLPSAVGAGTRVDVWFNPRATPGSSAPATPAHVVAENVLVEDVTLEDSMFAGAEFGSVQLLLTADLLPAVLAAMGSDGSLVVVPRA